MPRKKKGRSRQGTGAITDWIRNGQKVGRVGFIDLPRGADGKRKRKAFYGKDDTEVTAKMADFRQRMDEGLNLETERLTLADYLDQWLRDTAPLSVRPVTLDSYERKIRVHIRPALGATRLSQLKPLHLQQFYAMKLRSGQSNRSVQYMHAVLHKALADAVRLQLLANNPAERVKAPTPDHKEARVIPPDQVAWVVEAIKDDWLYPFWYVALASGCRRGELCALRWADVQWDRSIISISRSTQELPAAQGGIQHTDTKTRSGRRPIPLPPQAMEALQVQRELQQQRGHCPKGEGFVFTAWDGRPLRPSTVTHHWEIVRKRAGVPEVTLHGLRHTHATMLLLSNTPPRVVMERLGHSTITIGQNLYAHVMQSMQDEAAQRIGQLLPPARKAAPET